MLPSLVRQAPSRSEQHRKSRRGEEVGNVSGSVNCEENTRATRERLFAGFTYVTIVHIFT